MTDLTLPTLTAVPGVPDVPSLVAEHAEMIRAGVRAAGLDTPLAWCPGMDAGDLLVHLGATFRVAAAWIRYDRRPRVEGELGPDDGDPWRWFAEGRDAMLEVLMSRPSTAPAASWSPVDHTLGFWQRRMLHETAIHALDASHAAGGHWSATEPVALDGIAEVMELWLPTQLGRDVRGNGSVTRVAVTGGRHWVVGLHPQIVEVHDREPEPDAAVTGAAADLYRWLWGRGAEDSVRREGDPTAIVLLRNALTRAMQ